MYVLRGSISRITHKRFFLSKIFEKRKLALCLQLVGEKPAERSHRYPCLWEETISCPSIAGTSKEDKEEQPLNNHHYFYRDQIPLKSDLNIEWQIGSRSQKSRLQRERKNKQFRLPFIHFNDLLIQTKNKGRIEDYFPTIECNKNKLWGKASIKQNVLYVGEKKSILMLKCLMKQFICCK